MTRKQCDELFAEDENFYDPPENGEPDDGPQSDDDIEQSNLDDLLAGDSSLRPPTTHNSKKIG